MKKRKLSLLNHSMQSNQHIKRLNKTAYRYSSSEIYSKCKQIHIKHLQTKITGGDLWQRDKKPMRENGKKVMLGRKKNNIPQSLW